MKAEIKTILAKSPRLALLASYAYSLLNGAFALIYRLRYLGRAYVPLGVKLIGISKIRIGLNASIGVGSWLNVNHRDSCNDGIVIGDNTIVGQDNFFSSGGSIIIGQYCLTTKSCSFVCSSHVYDNPELPYALTGTSANQNIVIGDNCFFGFGSKVIGNVTIGHGCVIGAGAVVRQSIPPFSLVVGEPATIIKRYDFATRQWIRASADSQMEMPTAEEYRALLKTNGRLLLQPISALGGVFFDVP